MSFWLIALFGGAAALTLGSFVGALAHRLPDAARLRDVLHPARSACPACGATLHARDLVPIVSYLWLRARCRACGAKISPDYAVCEAGTLAAFLLALALSPLPGFWLVFTLFAALLLLVAVIDRRHLFVPDAAVIALALLWVFDAAALHALPVTARDALIASVAASGVLFALRFAFRKARGLEALGLGDVKLAAALGLFIGWQSVGLFFAFAAIATLLAIAVTRARAEGDARIPFAPGLCAGAALLVLLLEAKLLPL
jgi:prepilin signal peptidase PulO-like enzyme (type II secretory pathway)